MANREARDIRNKAIGRASRAYKEAVDTAHKVCDKAIEEAWKVYHETIDKGEHDGKGR